MENDEIGVVNFIIASLFVIGLVVLSMRAEQSLKRHDRLPMQWGLNGKPTWFAPRKLALYSIPVLCALVMVPLTVAAHVFSRPPTPSDGVALPMMIMIGLGYVLADLGYLWALRRWSRTA